MTEEVSQKFTGLDEWPTLRAVQAMHDGQLDAVRAITPALPEIAQAADYAASRLSETGRLIYVGAGTSGRLAVQDGSELGPTFSWPQNRLVYCMAGGMDALTVSQEGAEDIAEDGHAAIRDISPTPQDVVICVAASGHTPFTLGALRDAKTHNALTIGICNNPDAPILTEADHGLLAETSQEVIAGSTRMKAGTAQKAILNMLSSAIMIRLGRVYDSFMVDMIVSNAKLNRRAINMVSHIAACSPAEAEQALGAADNHIKTAILICVGAELSEGQAILKAARGNLRAALAAWRSKA